MNRKNIEDIYPLSSLQEGLLFESLQAPDSGVYFEQLKFRFENGLDVDAWKGAWESIVHRYDILRTAILWQNQDKMLQVVFKSVSIPWQLFDWRGLHAGEQKKRLESFLQADRQQGFDFSRAPLVRMTLIRLDDNVYESICSHHHVLLDGWSTSIIIKEVLACYKGEDLGPGAAGPRPYKDYILWLGRQDMAKAQRFWRAYFEGFTVPAYLSNNHQRRQDDGGEKEFKTVLSREASARLRSFASARNITLNVLVTAAWALLLSRYSGQADVVFGVVLSGRPAALEGVDRMVGLFINILPLRVLTPPDTPVAAWLHEVQARLLDLQDYSYTPLVKVQAWSQVPPETPLFESMIAFDNYPADLSRRDIRNSLGIADITSIEKSSYPLALIATPAPELLLKIAFNPSYLEPASARTMLQQLSGLLEEPILHAEVPLSSICVLTREERELVLGTWNQTARAYSLETTLHGLFETQVSSTPDAPAIRCEGQQLTFRELNERANCVAHYLQSMGAGPDMLVGICIERCPEMIVGLLGILKSGAAYVPIDPAYPTERVRFLMEDAALKIVLTKDHLLQRFSRQQTQAVSLDSEWDRIVHQSGKNPNHQTLPENIAYCIYTSGSSGKPKGVLVPHRGICNTLQWMKESLSLSSNDRILLSLSFSFDASVWQIFGPLIAGSSLVLNSARSFDSSETVASILRNEITITDFVPSMLQVFLDEPDVEKCRSLRYVLCGGEALTADLRNRFFSRLGARLLNVYGPTEISIDASSFTCTPEDRDATVPIGRAIANKQLYILDYQLQPVPIGIVGELFIAGEGLARGYLNRPGLTAEKFLPNPFSQLPGGRLYRTGDLARFLPNGSIHYVGRIDSQLKIRGFRVELGEIETVIGDHPDIRESVVVARDDGQGGKRLLAYVVTRNAVSPLNLRRFLEAKLPDYMVPAEIIVLAKLRVNAAGKVDRDRLPEPASSRRTDVQQSPIWSGSPMDDFIAEVWGQVLGTKKVGPQDNFFALGGNSLSAMRVLSRLRAAFKAELPLRIIFDFPTVSALAGAVEKAIKKSENFRPSIMPASRTRPPRMSFAQQRLWFVDRLVPEHPLYNMHLYLCFSGVLHADVLEDALNQVVERHEALRTAFANADGELIQVISPEAKVPLAHIDLTMFPEEEKEEHARRVAAAEAERPFDLTQGPLLRASLLRLNQGKHGFLLIVHHIIADGWSISILLGELAAFYKSKVTGVQAELPSLTIQYADFSEWQMNWLHGDVLRSELDYWKEQLQSAPALIQLPTDRSRPAVQTFAGAVNNFTIPKPLMQPLQYLCRQETATMSMTLLAVFKVLLYRYSSQESIVVASPVAGRSWNEVEHVIGLFINTIVFHTRMGGQPTFREVLRRVREVSLGAYMHQNVPFEKIVEHLHPRREASYAPIFQVMFELQSAPAVRIEFPQLTISSNGVENQTAKFDLSLDLQESEQGILGSFEYSTDLFDSTTIARMTGHFQTLITAISRNPDHKITDLQMLTEAEMQQLTASFAPVSTIENASCQVHRLIEGHAKQTPDAAAVVFRDQRISYGDLNRRANGLALHLRSLGIGPECVVGVCMERSPELIVALLAIWKAGAAYVPLNPLHPQERLAFILKQVNAPLLMSMEGVRPDLAAHVPGVLYIDFASNTLSCGDEVNLAIQQDPDSLAYVIFTSGSTGNPKGVMVSHASLLSAYLGWEKSYELTSGGSHLQMANFSFDVFVGDLVRALCSGSMLVICPEEIMLAPEKLYRLMQAEKIDSAEFVPQVMRILAAHLKNAGLRLEFVRNLVVGSDSWYATEYESLKQHCGTQTRIINSYGVTEATIDSTFFQGQLEGAMSSDRLVPIGHPFPTCGVLLVNENLQPAPVGVPGELCVCGPAVARGYLGQPDLTADKFVPHPFSREAGARMYRTGDLARYLPDGTIELVGRTDHVVKVRGFRIELGEIEAVLAEHPAIASAVVVASSSSGRDKDLVAYCVCDDESLTLQQLRDFLRVKLPTYMVPSFFVFLNALPLLASGKIDRQALPSPDGSRSERQSSYVAPRDNIENNLCEIWTELLQKHPVGIHDNFFELGGHSLLALRLTAEIEKRFHRTLPLNILFQKGTITELASVLRKQIAPEMSALVAINPSGSRAPLFFVHVGSGNVLCYFDLARHLGDDQPFYGLQDLTLSGAVAPFSSIEEMAAHYVREVRSVQPAGPYLIGGWSFGGLVAFEMARQLSALGHEPVLLAILDSGTPDMEREFESRMDDAGLLAILAHEMYLPIASNDLRLLEPEERLRFVADHMTKVGLIFEDPVSYLRRQLEIFKYRNVATTAYFPGAYSGRVALFEAAHNTNADASAVPVNLAERWANFAKGVDVYRVPGSHHEIAREPHVRSLAKLLGECIAQSLSVAGYAATNPIQPTSVRKEDADVQLESAGSRQMGY